MKIELLDFEGCPHAEPTAALLAEVLHDLAPGTPVLRRHVADAAEVEACGMAGSPTVLVDGRDLEPEPPPPTLGCRLYEGGDGTPPRWLVEAAVLRAMAPRHLLFLCVANSARSQLAEGLARALAPEGLRISSAGSDPGTIRPEAVEALAAVGVDAAGQRSKGLGDVDLDSVDAVITLCAEEVCPRFPRPVARLHWGLPDPAAVEEPGACRASFASVRDELARRLEALLG